MEYYLLFFDSGTLKMAFFANLMIKSVAKKINMVSVAIISQSYN